MSKSDGIRRHLLDEEEIFEAIDTLGLNYSQKALIVAILVERYVVDLDLLASVFTKLGPLSDEDAVVREAA
ncbi:hypothetical protein [uncultured Cohaesibacter sp.]|uniref:hypothetical protein n=1 Tax=uncultured Cohaesibacter sp. TaxID=1002546 RepID=UPI00292FC6CD|nr:hypothetical protein [uncultured Cohaesibacter sp.]